ncbi:flagellar hook-associated protein FlgL [Undibacterium fentianense]|uniref:Flagellar hook-associated protein FlgL n=1 Tax=Undibacterium fentianense TaxID=2828728 RepID=A0A941E308_9BURK|nr:flagellar hook-associated protein FlgL [Undibacterium fentianense]MBR7798778.1 flagellar hook-associated protein FlgL [Undibacterium fentianense]
MRISTSTIYENGGSRISELQSNLNRTMQQIASQRRILTPSDDPIGSARALVISQSAAVNDQLAVNRRNATNTLSMAEDVLGSVTTALQSVKTLIVSGGNGILTDQQRGYIAKELQGHLDEIIGLANSTDGTDSYLFGGYSSTTAPFVKTQGGAQYVGDQGTRYLQVDTSRQLPVSEVGSAIFGNIRTSNGQFNVRPNSSNVGQATASVAISNAANLTGNNYEVAFDNTGLNFTVTNKTTGAIVIPSTVYASPHTVTIDGMDITLTDSPGAPGANDKFSIQSGNQDIFQTITDLINALNTPASTDAGKLDLKADLSQANANLEKSLSNILVARTSFGMGLREIEDLDSSGASAGLLYKQELSNIQDLDYAKAITDLNQSQMVLQAAQQSFVKVSSLSLFNYIN